LLHKLSSDGKQVTSKGKSFHIHEPATGKVRRPTVESLTAGTNRLSVVENQSCLLRWDVSGAGEILKEQRSISMQHLTNLHFNTMGMLQHCLNVYSFTEAD